MKILIYKDEEKALFSQDGFYVLYEKQAVTIGTGTMLHELPDWYKLEVRNKKIESILQD